MGWNWLSELNYRETERKRVFSHNYSSIKKGKISAKTTSDVCKSSVPERFRRWEKHSELSNFVPNHSAEDTNACSEFVPNHFLCNKTQNRRISRVFSRGPLLRTILGSENSWPPRKTARNRRFCVLLYKKWFVTNSEHKVPIYLE
jgi:hypothetical protein